MHICTALCLTLNFWLVFTFYVHISYPYITGKTYQLYTWIAWYLRHTGNLRFKIKSKLQMNFITFLFNLFPRNFKEDIRNKCPENGGDSTMKNSTDCTIHSILYSIIRIMKLWRLWWAGHVSWCGKTRIIFHLGWEAGGNKGCCEHRDALGRLIVKGIFERCMWCNLTWSFPW